MSDKKKRIRKNRYKKQPSKRPQLWISIPKLPLAACIKATGGACAVGFISVLLIFAHDLLVQCDYFQTKWIHLEGIERLSRAEILEKAGVKEGENILALNLSLIRSRLLSHPWIAEADVQRSLPSRLNIHVKEHQPLAYLDMGRSFIIDDQGEIFKEKATGDPVHLPVISGMDYSDLHISGQPHGAPFANVMRLLRLWQGDKHSLPEVHVMKINIDRELGITLQTSGRMQSIRLGFGEYQTKYSRLKNILKYIDTQKTFPKIDTIDLSNPDRVILRPEMLLSSAVHKKEVTRAGT